MPQRMFTIVKSLDAVSYTHLDVYKRQTLNNGGAFMAPEPDDETWVLFNVMHGNRAEMSPEAAGIAACLMAYSLSLIHI